MTNQNRYRRLLALLTAVLMAAGVCIPAGISADESESNVSISPWTPADNGISVITDYSIQADANAVISFDDEDGAATAIHIQSGTVSLSTAAETSERIIVNGDATVILNGVTIAAEGGPAIEIRPGVSADLVLSEGTVNTVSVKSGQYAAVEPMWESASNMASLTISGSGALNATGGAYSAGIGGSKDFARKGVHGNITILGGTITAKAVAYSEWAGAAGIGTSDNPGNGTSSGSYKFVNDRWGTITIRGGEIYATGSSLGAGIGGGNHSDSGKIVIEGGTINAKGHTGIGCGYGSSKPGGGNTKGPGYYYADITITGGHITATAYTTSPGTKPTDNSGAGIGGGEYCDAIIRISGNTVIYAYGGKAGGSYHHGGAGIGGGYLGHAHVTIEGGTITANGGCAAAGIGSGGSPNNNSARGSSRRNGQTTCESTVVTVTSGKITATAGEKGAAGIGGGVGADKVSVSISGGNVTAYGAQVSKAGDSNNEPSSMMGGAGIGSGVSGDRIGDQDASKYFVDTDVRISITGGTVTSFGGWGAAGIGSGAGDTRANSVHIGSGANIEAYSDGTKFALDTRGGSNTSVESYVLQGTFMYPWTASSGTQDARGLGNIVVANDGTGWSRTLTQMRPGYRSFATNVSGVGQYSVYTKGDADIAGGAGAYFSASSEEGTASAVTMPDNKNGDSIMLPLTAGALSDNYFLYPVKTIVVEKVITAKQGVDITGLNMTVSFALKDKGTGNYITVSGRTREEISIVDGVPTGKALFVNVPEGSYDVMEMNGDIPMAAGTRFGDYTLERITTEDSTGGTTNNADITPDQWTDRVTVKNEFDQPPTTIKLKKTVVGEIWLVRCDVMDGTTFRAGGGIWKEDVISNPIINGKRNTSKEGHRSQFCGSEDHWIVWADQNGVPIRMDEIKSGATGGTLPTVVYQPQYELTKEEILSVTRENTELYNKYVANFQTAIEWKDIDLTKRIYWTTQNKNQVWYHTGVAVKADPKFMIVLDGNVYSLATGESVTIDDVDDGIHQLSEYENARYYLSAVTKDGQDVSLTGAWTAEIEIAAGQVNEIELINKPVTPPPTTPPTPPTPPGEITERTIVKVWNDADDQDGKRPESIDVVLKADGKVNQTVTLSAANNWTATVKNLPKKANNKEISYTWGELSLPNGYTFSSAIEGTVTTITNTHVPEKTEATVQKAWDDSSNQDGKRPESIRVSLAANGTNILTTELNAGNNWTYTEGNLDMYAGGERIAYVWTEDESGLPDGYALTSADTEGTVTTLTNSYDPEKTSATVRKAWDDNNNQDGIRPTSIHVTLTANGKEAASADLSDANNWSYTAGNLDRYAGGREIEYAWTESGLPEGYELTGTSVNGTVTTLTNAHEPEKTEATVRKVWEDAENQDGIRPAELTVTLSTGDTAVLNAGNNWTATVKNLPKYAAGKEIKYTWTESELPEGYTLESASTEGTVTTLTNAHEPEKTEATVRKVWEDAENQDGIRPAELTVTLSNGDTVTLNAGNNWTATVEDLPKYASGEEIEYTWTESGLPEGYELTGTSVNGTVTTLTNAHVPEKTEATVRKAWNDSSNQDGKRPESVRVSLAANGTSVLTAELNNGNKWTYTAENLDMYAGGERIAYVWTEDESKLPAGYALTASGAEGTVTTLTNSYDTEKTSATVRKVWDDKNNQDGIRPATIHVMLTANGKEAASADLNDANNWSYTAGNLDRYANGREIEYAWTESGLPEGYELTDVSTEGTVTTLTNAHVPETTEATVRKVWDDKNNQDGIRPGELSVTLSSGDAVTLNEENNWTATVTGLPKYENGNEIVYSWTETAPDGYELINVSAEGTVTTLTNAHVPETTEATVRKVWDDKNNQDGIRPGELSVTLSNGDTVTLDAENNWTATVTGLPKYENGEEIAYSWTETVPEGYELTDVSAEGTVTTLTNAHVPGTTEATVRKVWDDAENQDGIRPGELSVTLSNGDTVTLDAENNWTATVTGLPKYENGEEIAYSWTETVPEGYELTDVSTEGTVTTLTNAHVPGTTEATVVKIWEDAENQDGIRRGALCVTLSSGETVAPNAENEWTATVTGLPKNENGEEIAYSWTETVPEGYELTDVSAEGTVTTLTNVHVPETTEATVRKVWDDAENQDGIRPGELTVTLSTGDTVTLSAENNWTATVTGLPKYENGEEIAYSWTETVPEGYELTDASAEGTVTTLTNVHVPETTEATVVKVWDDAENQDGIRPGELTVTLSTGDTVTLSAENNWTATVSGLPMYADGEAIEYSWTEGELPEGYELTGTAADGTVTTLTNTHVPATVSTTVRKVWEDNGNARGVRPATVRVYLSNGMSAVLNAANGWTVTISGLPAYAQGEAVTYTWTEQAVGGYTQVSAVTEGTETIFTNRIIPQPTVPTGNRQPKIPKDEWTDVDEYETALGLETSVNHVGDCFD